jgi:hypothetical protein
MDDPMVRSRLGRTNRNATRGLSIPSEGPLLIFPAQIASLPCESTRARCTCYLTLKIPEHPRKTHRPFPSIPYVEPSTQREPAVVVTTSACLIPRDPAQ